MARLLVRDLLVGLGGLLVVAKAVELGLRVHYLRIPQIPLATVQVHFAPVHVLGAVRVLMAAEVELIPLVSEIVEVLRFVLLFTRKMPKRDLRK